LADAGEVKVTSPKISGERVIVKALVAIVNREEKKKMPFRRVNLCFSESPYA
jgi:hypothetical protein